MSDVIKPDPPMVGDEPMYEWATVSATGEAHVQVMRVPGGYIYSLPQSMSAVFVSLADAQDDPYVAVPDRPV
jgi:hypothetical protein